MKIKLNKKSVIWIWLVSYLIVLSFPLLASYVLYRSFLASAMENAENLNYIALSQTSAGVEGIFTDIRSTGRQILNRPEVLTLSSAELPLSIHRLERFGSFQARLREFVVNSDYLRNIYVYFNDLGLTASTEGMFGNESFITHLSGNLNIAPSTLSSWIYDADSDNFQVRMAGAAHGLQQANQIVVTMSISPSLEATLIFVADSIALRGILADTNHYLWAVSPGDGLVICRPEAQTFAETAAIDFSWGTPGAFEAALAPWDMVVQVMESPMTGWLLVSAIPIGEYAAELQAVGQVYAVFLLVSAAVGIVVSTGLIFLNYRPLSRLSAIIETESPHEPEGDTSRFRNEYEYLENSLAGLIGNTRRYETELERQRILLAKRNLIRLLRGTLYTEQAFSAFCRDYGFTFSSDNFMVVCVNIRDYDVTRIAGATGTIDDKLYMSSVENAEETIGAFLEGQLSNCSNCYHCFYDGYTYLILSPTGSESVFEICEESHKLARDRYGIEIAVYISALHSGGHIMIRKAYLEAKQGMEQMEALPGNPVKVHENRAPSPKPESEEPLSSAVVKYINENYCDPALNVASVADKFGYSSSYLLRVFKKDMNCGLLDYIRRQRVDAAKTLLLDTAKTISEIAAITGHTNPLALIRAFKRLEGITPTDYRNMMR